MNLSNGSDCESSILYMANGFPVRLNYLILQTFVILVAFAIIYLNLILVVAIKRAYKPQEVSGHIVVVLPIVYGLFGLFFIWHSAFNLLNFENEVECLLRLGTLHTLISWIFAAIANLVTDR